MAGFWKNLITFGAAQRVDDAMEENRRLMQHYESVREQCKISQERMIEPAKQFIKLQIKAQKQAKKLNTFFLLKEFKNGTYENNTNIPFSEIQIINKSLSNGDILMSSLEGAVCGAVAPSVLFSAVSTFGIASTGTSIATLTGIAQTNATLAAIGGGSIAAGGGGIALGTAVLNWLPGIGIGVAALASHLCANKNIKEIEENSNEIVYETEKLEDYKLSLDCGYKRLTGELIPSLSKAISAFRFLYWKTYFIVYPLGPISKFFKGNGAKLGPKDMERVRRLASVAKNMLKIRDTKVFD